MDDDRGHLLKTVCTDSYWPVAGADLSLLVTGGIAASAARKLALRERGSIISKTGSAVTVAMALARFPARPGHRNAAANDQSGRL